MIIKGWTPDVIVGLTEIPIPGSVRTLYRLFKANYFDIKKLPLKDKCKPNGHNERRGKQVFKRNLAERLTYYPQFNQVFGHLEGDTIVGFHHKSAVITLVERLSKVIISLKSDGRKVADIENATTSLLQSIPKKDV